MEDKRKGRTLDIPHPNTNLQEGLRTSALSAVGKGVRWGREDRVWGRSLPTTEEIYQRTSRSRPQTEKTTFVPHEPTYRGRFIPNLPLDVKGGVGVYGVIDSEHTHLSTVGGVCVAVSKGGWEGIRGVFRTSILI